MAPESIREQKSGQPMPTKDAEKFMFGHYVEVRDNVVHLWDESYEHCILDPNRPIKCPSRTGDGHPGSFYVPVIDDDGTKTHTVMNIHHVLLIMQRHGMCLESLGYIYTTNTRMLVDDARRMGLIE